MNAHNQAENAVRWEQARQLAARVALQAWREAIAPLYHAEYKIREKPDGPCTEADKRADQLIVERLALECPGETTGYLTEESEDRRERLARHGVWIIDPIDGTKDFIKKNGNFAIHIALTEELEPGEWLPVAAVVFRPASGGMYSAARGQGAWRQSVAADSTEAEAARRGAPVRVSQRAELGKMRSAVSNANRESRLMRLIKGLGLENYWHVGSLGVKACQIAEGNAELYVNMALGKVKEWDVCAPHLLLAEAGGRMTDLDGRELTYNHDDFVLRRGLLATNGPLHGDLLKRIEAFLIEDRKLHA